MLFTQYSFVIIEYTSRGCQRIPKISGDMLLPEKSPLFFKGAVIVSVFAALFFLVPDPKWQLAVLTLSLLLFPVSLVVLIIEKSFFLKNSDLKWKKIVNE